MDRYGYEAALVQHKLEQEICKGARELDRHLEWAHEQAAMEEGRCIKVTFNDGTRTVPWPR